jgi:hypothetical protein
MKSIAPDHRVPFVWLALLGYENTVQSLWSYCHDPISDSGWNNGDSSFFECFKDPSRVVPNMKDRRSRHYCPCSGGYPIGMEVDQ